MTDFNRIPLVDGIRSLVLAVHRPVILESTRMALFGEKPVWNETFSTYNAIGTEEKASANAGLGLGVLTRTVGVWCESFKWNFRVWQLERVWAGLIGDRHAALGNSAILVLFVVLGMRPSDQALYIK